MKKLIKWKLKLLQILFPSHDRLSMHLEEM